MLRVEKTTLGTFGEPELAGLINSRGWKSVLPDALDDQHLLLISDQLRDLLGEARHLRGTLLPADPRRESKA